MRYTIHATDDHGQPLNLGFHWKDNCTKLYGLLRGFATGALADGKVSDEEAAAFRGMLQNADEKFRRTPPFSFIIDRVERIFSDGVIEEDERQELTAIFEQLALETEEGSEDSPCEMIYTISEPALVFGGSFFTVTGKFALGTRSKVVTAIENAGGSFLANLSSKTTFLLVGSFVSRDWKHSDLGNKIEKALSLGVPVVREQSLVQALGTGSQS